MMQNKKTEEQDDKEKKRRKLLVFWLPLFSILLLAGVLGLVLGITLKPAKNYVSVHVTYENGNVVGIKDKYTLNEEVTFTAVPNQGYYFAGWIIDGTLDKTNPIKFYANDNEISALFIISTEFGVFLHVDGYTTLWGSTGYPVTNIVLKDVVKEYYTFSGWYIGDDTHSEYATLFEIGYDIAGELHLWAKLDANTHDLYIDLNGDGLYTGPGETLLNHHDEEIVSLPPSVVSLNPGEYFINWAIELNGAGPATFSNPSNVIGDALIYPVFSTESYNITFNENGGATVTDGIFAYGATLPTDTKTGYTFNGWFVEGSEGVLYNGTVPDLGNNNQSVTLNASWTIESYNITFDLDGGTGVTDGSYTYNTLLPAPTKAGYTFLGYSSVDNSSVEFEDPSNVIDFGANGASVTLYAIYEASDSTAYTVNHYFENAAGTSYVLDSTKTQSLTGETDTQATASALTVSGFTYNSSHESEVKQGNIAGDGSLVLSLYYLRNTYSITFNSEGGSAVSAIEDVRHGASVNAPAEPTKTGYDFIGWYETSPSLLYTFTTMPIGGVALHASWDAHTYTVVYNSNKPASATGTVTGTTSSSVHTYDVSKNLTANGYALVGYTFTGWATTAVGSKAYNEAQAVTNLAADGTYNLYAVWEANTYTVSYNNNGGTGEIASATATYDSDFTLSDGAEFSKTGYTLTGWATSAEGAKVYDLEEAFEPYLLTVGLSLYAYYEAHTYTVVYNSNKPASATGTVTGTTSSSVHTYDVSKNLTANGYALVGYTFTGWATTAAGAKAYNEAQAVTNLAADGTYNLYAVWEANTYTVTYDNNGGTGEIASATATYDSDFTLSNGSSFSKTGYTLTGWATSAEGAKVYNLEEAFEPYLLTAGLDLYAVWTVWQVTITYQGNSGLYEEASSYTQVIKYNETPYTPTSNQFSKVGYHFVGWTEVVDSSTVSVDGTYILALITSTSSTATLYAKWTIDAYIISFDSNGGSAVSNVNINYNAAITFSTPTRTGYSFSGWYDNETDNNGSGNLINYANVPDLGEHGANVTYYAKWTALTYTVTYEYNGADDGNSALSFSVTYDSKYTGLADPKKTGYVFEGWWSADGAEDEWGTQIVNGTTTYNASSPSDHTIYAKWAPVTGIVVTFEYNGADGGNAAPNKQVTYGDTYGELPAPTRTTYRFDGWYLDEEFTTSVTAATAVASGVEHSLYAKWVKTYVLTVNTTVNGDISGTSNGTYDVNTTISIDATPSSHYHFVGWYTLASEGTLVYAYASYEFGLTANTTLYAIFAIDTFTVTWTVTTVGFEDVYSEQDTNVPYGTVPSYDHALPADNAEWIYNLGSWSDDPTAPITNDIEFTRTISRAHATYTVTWLVTSSWNPNAYDEIDENVEYGADPAYNTTLPVTNAQYTYVFSGWDPVVSKVTGHITYTATLTQTLRSYTINWIVNLAWDGTDHSYDTTSTVDYGDTPQRGTSFTNNYQYTYTESEWSPAIVAVTGEATYTRTVTRTLVKYGINFIIVLDWDLENESYNQSIQVGYGLTPAYTAFDLASIFADTLQYDYTIGDWDNPIINVVGNCDYTLTISRADISYTITWVVNLTWDTTNHSYDDTSSLLYNASPAYKKANLASVFADTAEYDYTISSWTPAVVDVVANATYTITITRVGQEYTITYKDNTDITYSGSNLAALPTTHTYDGGATALVSGVKDGYRFDGWYLESDCSGSAVTSLGSTEYTEDITLYALWSRVVSIAFSGLGGNDDLEVDKPFAVIAEGDSITITLPVTSASGASFVWYLGDTLLSSETTDTYTFTVSYDTHNGKTIEVSYGFVVVVDYPDSITELNELDTTFFVVYATAVGSLSSYAVDNIPGYNFVAWYIDAEFIEGNLYEAITSLTSSLTLYAKYAVASTHTVTFVFGSISISVDGIADEEFTVPNLSLPSQYSVYVLAGWSTTPEGAVQYHAAGHFTLVANITLYAVLEVPEEEVEVTLYFDANVVSTWGGVTGLWVTVYPSGSPEVTYEVVPYGTALTAQIYSYTVSLPISSSFLFKFNQGEDKYSTVVSASTLNSGVGYLVNIGTFVVNEWAALVEVVAYTGEELLRAITVQAPVINVKADLSIGSSLIIDYNVTINGNNHTLSVGGNVVIVNDATINDLTIESSLSPSPKRRSHSVSDLVVILSGIVTFNNVTISGSLYLYSGITLNFVSSTVSSFTNIDGANLVNSSVIAANSLIAALPSVGDLRSTDEEAVVAARTAVTNLGNLSVFVSDANNIDVLEEAIADAKEEAADFDESVSLYEVSELVKSDTEEIEFLREYYDLLDLLVQDYVTSLAALVALEAKIEELNAAPVEGCIVIDSPADLGLPASYNTSISTVNFSGVTFGYYYAQRGDTSTTVQLQNPNGELYNTTAITGIITRIVINQTTPYRTFSMSFGATSKAKTEVKSGANVQAQTITPAGGYSYFYIYSASQATHFTSIEIYYIELSTAEKLDAAKTALVLNPTDPVTASSITLPTTSLYGSTVSWESSDSSIISSTGQVTHPFVSTNPTVTLTATITISGQTEQKPFTITVAKADVVVTFDLKGATTPASIPNQTISYNGTVTAPATPAKTGFVFLYWQKVGTTGAYDFESNIVVAGNFTLEAIWEAEVKVTFTFAYPAWANEEGGVLELYKDGIYILDDEYPYLGATYTIEMHQYNGIKIRFWENADEKHSPVYSFQETASTSDNEDFKVASNTVYAFVIDVWNLNEFSLTLSINTSETVTAQYTGITTNMVAGNNNASLIGLDPSLFNVTAQKTGSNISLVGLNADGSIRLYTMRTDATQNNILTFTIDPLYYISSIVITFGAGTNTPSNANLIINAGGEVYNGVGLANTSRTYSDLYISSFYFKSFDDTNNGSANSQIFITSIVITYQLK